MVRLSASHKHPPLLFKEGRERSGRGGKVLPGQHNMLINNLLRLKPLRRKLRANLTPAEAALWKHLQKSQLDGRKFRRQHSVSSYILDFYCPTEKLAVELDGAAHDYEQAYLKDAVRDKYLKSLGITVIRFENCDVLKNLEGVLLEIKRHFKVA